MRSGSFRVVRIIAIELPAKLPVFDVGGQAVISATLNVDGRQVHFQLEDVLRQGVGKSLAHHSAVGVRQPGQQVVAPAAAIEAISAQIEELRLQSDRPPRRRGGRSGTSAGFQGVQDVVHLIDR